jgi:predicted P-loop ATPase
VYLGAEVTQFVMTVGAKWMISAVARIYAPGSKADAALILEGPQGTGKSTALNILASENWFTDQIKEIGSKDTALSLQGVLIVELGELSALTRAEVEDVKQWISQTFDRFRVPYGHYTHRFERQCVFAGTTNRDDYLRDETGGRRFWPIRTGTIDLDTLRRDRDQLWAEAVHRYRAGETWHLDAATEELARDEQEARLEQDAIQPKVEAAIRGRDGLTLIEVIEATLPNEKPDMQLQRRFARCLRHLGLERRRAALPGRKKGPARWFRTEEVSR